MLITVATLVTCLEIDRGGRGSGRLRGCGALEQRHLRGRAALHRERLAARERPARAIGLGLEACALAGAELPGQITTTPLLQHVRDLMAEALAPLGCGEIIEAGSDVHLLADGDALGPVGQRSRRVRRDRDIAGSDAERAPHLRCQRRVFRSSAEGR
jgi:hypothetical protein